MPNYNCVYDTTLLSVKRYGASPLAANAGETLANDCGKRLSDELKYTKIVDGVMVSMTAGEITTVDNAADSANDIVAAVTLTKPGGYTISQVTANYVITLPAVSKGATFLFELIAEGIYTVTIQATGLHLYGTKHLAGTSSQIDAQLYIIFDATFAKKGDTVRMTGLNSNRWDVIGISTDGAGITTGVI